MRMHHSTVVPGGEKGDVEARLQGGENSGIITTQCEGTKVKLCLSSSEARAPWQEGADGRQ